MMDKNQIKQIIPYDEPFLFVDEVTEISDNKITGLYSALKNYEYFKGHFVDFKIMPGVLVIEGLAQLSSILLRKGLKDDHKKYFFLAYEVKNAKFLKPIFPGNKIKQEAEVLNISEANNIKIADVKAQAKVNETLMCAANFSIAIVEKQKFIQKANQ
jgi:3-hydroxyacyl-[acyl-carrier-protein] dehydratase